MANIIIDCSNCGNSGYEPFTEPWERQEACHVCKSLSILASMRFSFPFHDQHGEVYKQYVNTACAHLSKHPDYKLASLLNETVQNHKVLFESKKHLYIYAVEISETLTDCQKMLRKLP